MAYTNDDCIRTYPFPGSRTFRIKSSASSLFPLLRAKKIRRRAEATPLDPSCIQGQVREVCDVQLMVLSSFHSVDDKLRKLCKTVVMELEMAQQLTLRQKRRIANFAPTDGTTEVTHIIRCPSVLAEHVIYNLLWVLEIYKTTFGPNPAMLHGAKVIELVLGVFNMLQPFILSLESPGTRPTLLVGTTKDACLGMLGLHMTLEVANISEWTLEGTAWSNTE
jgi:hypothetical protein